MKPLLLIFCLMFCLTLSAQYDRGDWYVAGNTGIDLTRVSEDPPPVVNPIFPAVTERTVGEGGSFRTGYFPFDRFLLGVQVDYWEGFFREAGGGRRSDGALLISPFARYYLSGSRPRRINFFGELSFGTLGYGNAESFETNFQLGGGAEMSLAPGILGTANLNYLANSWGMNFSQLALGLNVLTGQLTDEPAAPRLAAGRWSVDGTLGHFAYGRLKRGGQANEELRIDFSPSVGYFPWDGWMLVLNTELGYTNETDPVGGQGLARPEQSTTIDAAAHLDFRYYVWRNGKLLPYIALGTGYRDRREKVFFADGSLVRETQYAEWRTGAGASYFFSSRVALEAQVRYARAFVAASNTGTPTPAANEDRVGVSAGVRLFFP